MELTRILCVDDEPNVLSALQRTLFDKYDVTTAASGPEALDILHEEEPFTVVISDMRMPDMNGAALLSKVRELFPETIRVLLTGQTDLESAVKAINDGQIFRFLCKPCPEEQLKSTLAAATTQHALVKAERQLLEDTLNGAVRVLTETLSLAAPLAFQKCGSLKALVSHMVEQLQLDNGWQFRIAAMLAPIGCITLPGDVAERAYAGQPLSDEETAMLRKHPEVGEMLLRKIPRLEPVAQMIGLQATPDPRGVPSDVAMGAAMLRLAMEVDSELGKGKPLMDILRSAQAGRSYPVRLVSSLRTYVPVLEGVTKNVKVIELRSGMILKTDVVGSTNTILIAKGRVVDEMLIRRLENFACSGGVQEPIEVLCPT